MNARKTKCISLIHKQKIERGNNGMKRKVPPIEGNAHFHHKHIMYKRTFVHFSVLPNFPTNINEITQTQIKILKKKERKKNHSSNERNFLTLS